MGDADQTKAQLVTELAELHQRIADMQERLQRLDALEIAHQDVETQLQRRVQETNLLNRVTAFVASAEDVAGALRNVCAELARFLQVPQAGFAILNPERTAAEVIADYHPPGSPSAIGVTISVNGNPSMTYILERKVPLAVAEAQSDPLLAPVHDVMRQRKVQSILLVPILVEGEVIGTLGFDTFQRRVFSQADIELVQHVANQAGPLLMWKQTEESLRESEERFRNYFKLGLVGMVVASPERAWIEINDRLCETLGYSRAELVGKTWDELTYPEDVAPNMALLDRVRAGEMDGFSMEKRFIRKNGEIMTGNISTRCLRRPDGSIDSFVTLVQDITERKRAGDLIRAQHDLALKLGAATGLDETLCLCVEAAIHSAGMDAGGVYLVDEVSGDLHLAFSQGLSHDFVKAASYYDADSPSARLVMAGKPVYVNYLELGVPLDDVRHREGLRVVAILPVHHGEQVIACLNIASHTLDEIPATARDMLETIAAQIGSFVARARAESQRDATLETLRESEERFRTIIEDTEAGYFRVGRDGCWEHVNRAWLRMHGYDSPDEVIGQHFSLTQANVDLEYAQENVERLLNGESIPTGEFTRRRKDGSIGYHTFSAGPVISGGEIVGLEGFIIDITDRKWAERALRESEEKYRALYSSMNEGICINELIYDDSGKPIDYRITDVNLKYELTLGIDRGEAIGARASELYGTGKPPYLDICTKVAETGEPASFEAYSSLVDKHFTISVFSPGKGRFVTVFQDVTERKRALQELDRYRSHLEELVQERTRELERVQAELIRQERISTLGELTATIAHEIRNPLGTVRTSIFAIGDAVEREQIDRIKRALQIAERNIVRCDRIISELLEYARDRALELTPTHIDTWLDAVLNGQHIPQDIVCTRVLSCGVETLVDHEHLRRAVTNVVHNAIDALQDDAAAGNWLTVSTHVVGERADSRLEIRVSDTGPGIPGDVMDKIFEPLFSTKSFGIGLGLPIVKNIMEQHRGGVEVQSVVGQGTTVILWLPT
jgi:PAS domain S-box-containing protein